MAPVENSTIWTPCQTYQHRTQISLYNFPLQLDSMSHICVPHYGHMIRETAKMGRLSQSPKRIVKIMGSRLGHGDLVCGAAEVGGAPKPWLLSDNGPSLISEVLAEWLDEQRMSHVRWARNHHQTRGKIERWHRTLKNRILLKNYYLPGNLETQIAASGRHSVKSSKKA